MPKATPYRLTWNGAQQIYVLCETHNPTQPLPIAPGSEAWFFWLPSIPSFTFVGQQGQLTVRQEVRAGAGTYWYAYRRQRHKMLKRYLGRTADLTPARLEQVALHLTAPFLSPPKADVSAFPLPTQPAEDSAGERAAHDAPDPLLATKVHLPRPRAQLVPRAHLARHLQQGVAGPLTLISAPAGYGKTTVLTQWCASTPVPVAWLSLEAEENAPLRFLTYLIAAVQTLDPHFGAQAQARLRLHQSAEPETVLASLTNDLLGWQGTPFVLVLDDYHMISAQPIHQMVTHLVEHLPPQMRLIIATRGDPPLPLARWRARGYLTELRAAELRFDVAEAGAFLEAVMGLHLAREDVTILQRRTEGWIAGLQLAGLALQGRTDLPRALADFSGSHHLVLDYLSEEVLSRQPAKVQAFLLQTALLERLSGSLCDAVTGAQGSQAMLERLERANMFVVALDEVRGWYRYHHLFADLLRSRLQSAMPALIPELHQRASQWYEEQDLLLEAFHHARLTPDFDRPIRLIEQHTYVLAYRGQTQTLMQLLHAALSWLHTLPEALFQQHPRLSVSRFMLLLFTGQFHQAQVYLETIEQAILRVASGSLSQTFLNEVAALRAWILTLQGDLKSGVTAAQRALEHTDETSPEAYKFLRLTAAHHPLVSGDVKTIAIPEHAGPAPAPEDVGKVYTMDELFRLVDMLPQVAVLRLQGRLRQAAAIYEHMAQIQREHLEVFVHPGFCFGLGEIYYEWNDLDSAQRLLEQGRAVLVGPMTLAGEAVTQGYATLARLYLVRHQPTLATAIMDEFVKLATARHFVPEQLAAAAADRARLALMGGQQAAALTWAHASGLSAEDALVYPRERAYLIFARVRIAQGRLDPAGPWLAEAQRLLSRLRADAEVKAREGSLLEILVLQALALFARSAQSTQALTVLDQALLLAEREGAIRLFLDEGEPMRTFLRQARTQSVVPDFLETLLAAFGEQLVAAPLHPVALVEPLTERELAVLRLLAAGLSNANIARELTIVVGTVKQHVHSIYGKLQVQNRTQAGVRAQELHLL